MCCGSFVGGLWSSAVGIVGGHCDTVCHGRAGFARDDSFFDSGAVIGLDAGRDGLPGIAGVDDGANGVVDDRAELGATGSDDRLFTLSKTEYDSDPAAMPLVLQRGGWTRSTAATSADVPTREFFRTRDDVGVWEVMKQSGPPVIR